MRGSNTMSLCESVLIEALQEYFDKRWVEPEFLVKNVRRESNGPGPGPDRFEVRVEGLEEDEND